MTATTFPALLADQLRRAGSRPLVTYYDDATGERVELSVLTYANWVAKTAGLLQDELGVERGDGVLVDLPCHWLTPVWLGAVWSVGATVTTSATTSAPEPARVVVCGPDVGGHAATGVPVVALSLRPMAARFAEPLPAGVVDYGAVVWGQPDAFVPLDPPDPDDAAWSGDGVRLTQAEVVARGAGTPLGEPGARLLTDRNPATSEGLATLTGPLAAGGGTVWVAHADPAGWERRAATEQASVTLAGAGPAQPTRS